MIKSQFALVVLHYGDPALTARLHRQLLAADPEWSERIFVLDNAAPQPYPGAWLRLDANIYWAGALEYVVDTFAAQGVRKLWFLNNDVLFVSDPSYIGRALARLKRLEKSGTPVGCWAPAVRSNPYHPQMVVNPHMQVSEVALVDGIAPLLDLQAVAAAGGVDCLNNPYGYGVDLVLSRRIAEAGFRLVVDQQIVIRHTYHATARTVDGFMDKAARAEANYLASHLGPRYQDELTRWKSYRRDFDRI
ncbi:hypothetical protein DPQ33_06570 [Oceanidesulfovibrio indonesiensis]|uniref:Uncharacterized protein n=1 Tax=Oceanidesulfovibrio indonesiensis TaxID=54767 RepID=A0A7M3MGF9_9BACT|nr:hypothetical protein [Oceanidesulfovibrio indonesiensis]TVM18406.1 hypothetical protein DPQ33_06570 [Oceanidesulfovibrio indonesiensis]